MEKANGISRAVFELCHIEGACSPFFAHEKRSMSHADRLNRPLLFENGDVSQTDIKAEKE